MYNSYKLRWYNIHRIVLWTNLNSSKSNQCVWWKKNQHKYVCINSFAVLMAIVFCYTQSAGYFYFEYRYHIFFSHTIYAPIFFWPSHSQFHLTCWFRFCCFSFWNRKDFRPAYSKLGSLPSVFPSIPLVPAGKNCARCKQWHTDWWGCWLLFSWLYNTIYNQ